MDMLWWNHRTTEAAGVKRIFVVDPEPAFCSQIREVLDENLITVRYLMSEEDFWDEMGGGVPDLVILNFDFNEGEGTKIFSAMKMNPDTSAVAVIITSAGLSGQDIEPYAKLWGVCHLPKPTTTAALRECLVAQMGEEGLRKAPPAGDLTRDDIDQVFDSIFPDLAAGLDKKEQTDYHITVPSTTFEGTIQSDSDLPSDVAELKERLLRTDEDLREKQLLLDRFRDRLEEASRTAEDYRKKVDQQTEDANFLHRDIAASEEQTAVWQRRHDDLRAEFDRFRQQAELEAAERTRREQEREQEVVRLTTEAATRDEHEREREAERTRLTGEAGGLRQELEAARQERDARLAEAGERIQALDSQLGSLQGQLTRITQERELLVEQVNAFGERERTWQKESEAKTTQLEAETIVLKQRLAGLEAERREAVDKLENRLHQLEGEMRDSRERHEKALRLLDEALGLLKGQFELQ